MTVGLAVAITVGGAFIMVGAANSVRGAFGVPGASDVARMLGGPSIARADACPAPWDGLDVVRSEDVLIAPHTPWGDRLAGSGCVGVVVAPARGVDVRAQLVSREGHTWHEAWARPRTESPHATDEDRAPASFAFVRGCGEEPRLVIEATRSVVVKIVVVRDPPAELSDAACRSARPGVESRPPRLGPEPSEHAPTLPLLEAPWTLDTELALDAGRRIDVGVGEGCVRVDVAGNVHGGRVTVAERAFGLWGAPYGAWAAVCARGSAVVELEGEGPLVVRIARAASSTSAVGGGESSGLRAVARGAAREASVSQVHLRATERFQQAVAPSIGCRRWIAVAADEASDTRFELRALGPNDSLLGRGRGGPGRAARVDSCGPVVAWELVQLGPGGRVVIEEATW